MSDSSHHFASPSTKHAAPNVSGGWVVMILAFLVAVAVYFYVTQQQQQQFSIAVATSNLNAGQTLTADSFREVRVNMPKEQVAKLVSYSSVTSAVGQVASTNLTAGDPILRSALLAPAASDGLVSISIPVEKERAVGGALNNGDHIDIVDTTQGFDNSLAARDLKVLAVNTSTGSTLSGDGAFSITVACTRADSVNLAKAIDKDKFIVVKSTGAAPLPVSAVTPATTSTTVKK